MYRTVHAYLYALKVEIKLRGGKDIIDKADSWFVHSTMKHYLKTMGNKTLVYRRPLTIDLLQKLIKKLDLEDYDTRVMATMLVVGVYCLLRIGELCYVRDEDKTKFIKNKDFIFTPTHAVFTLVGTKTDFNKVGVQKYIADLKNSPFNPFSYVYALRSSKQSARRPEEAFFALKNGKPVTKEILVKFLRTNMNKHFPNIGDGDWSGISLRKGGATSAIRSGVADVVVQKLGNWLGESFKGYVDHTLEDVSIAQAKMAAWAARRQC